MSGNGLVVLDLHGGDAAFVLVDAERWAQIVEVHGGDWDGRLMTLYELIHWLASDDTDVDPPRDAPDRKGKVLKTWYTQTWVIEKANIEGVVGILTLPCY